MARRAAAFLAAFLVICGLPVLFPTIDLWASGLFYRPGAGFFLGGWAPFRIIHAAVPWLTAALAVVAPAWALLRFGPGRRGKAAIFLLAALAVGPGLVVNTLFKDHWGRARPAQTAEFGGEHRFGRAFVPSDQCRSNCSFPAGDPAIGFYFLAAGFLVAAPARRRAVNAGAIAFGGALGVVRIAQGGHFLSDVLASGFLVYAASWLLYRWIVVDDGLAALLRHLRKPPPALRRAAWLTALAAAGFAVSYAWLDRTLATALHAQDPVMVRLFGIITWFGLSVPWLVAAALAIAGCAIAARRTNQPAEKRRWTAHAWRAGFVFVAVAASGLAGDIMKPVFGRARPSLWLGQHIYGFTWHGAHAAYWSFPSGHAITIVALAAALAQVARRGWPLYAAVALLVLASRIALAQHYLGDLIGGALIAGAGVWATRAGFQRAGIIVATRSP